MIDIELSRRQAATVAAALTLLSACVILAVVLASFFLLARFVAVFSRVFMPLFVAMIMALVLRPVYELFNQRLRLSVAPSVALVFITFLLPFALSLWFFGALAVSQVSELAGRAPELADDIRASVESNWPQVKAFWDEHGLAGKLQEFLQGQAGAIWSAVQSGLRSAASAGASAFRTVAAALSWFVLPVYLAFFLVVPPLPRDLEAYLPFLKEQTREDVVYLVSQFMDIIVSFFRGQLIVAMGQGILFAVGFMVAGLQFGFILGLILGLLNLIPYLGSMIGLAITLPLAFFQTDGGAFTLLAVVVVFVIVQLIEGYYLTPKVMGGRTGLHPLTIMLALFFWGTAFDGIAGMILAIPLTAFIVVLWRLVRTRYMAELV
ncbi:MAG TPA: AI-2E family transporter [Vicinamibacteria bacterium]|nr:AI-2E family transporter [Vicinamibacteria bacterium]